MNRDTYNLYGMAEMTKKKPSERKGRKVSTTIQLALADIRTLDGVSENGKQELQEAIPLAQAMEAVVEAARPIQVSHAVGGFVTEGELCSCEFCKALRHYESLTEKGKNESKTSPDKTRGG